MSRRHHEPVSAVPDGWTLIGSQMVLLHALDHDAEPSRISTDLDIPVDTRVKDRVRLSAMTEIAVPAAARARLALRTLLPTYHRPPIASPATPVPAAPPDWLGGGPPRHLAVMPPGLGVERRAASPYRRERLGAECCNRGDLDSVGASVGGAGGGDHQ